MLLRFAPFNFTHCRGIAFEKDMPRTNQAVRNAKYNEPGKPNKPTDGNGLFLLFLKNGSKYWRYKYRFDGKEKCLALGVYPEVTI